MTERHRGAYLGELHPLALVAKHHCRSDHPQTTHRLGHVACGRCWERAIRADERVVVELGLSAEPVADPDLVDEVAVERACAGDPVRLTPAERRTAVARLLECGLTPSQSAARLGMSGSTMSAVVAESGVAA